MSRALLASCALVVLSMAPAVASAQECGAFPLIAEVGAGTPGTAGVPELHTLGQPMVEQPGMGLRITGGAPGAPAQIVVGSPGTPQALPAYGARLYPVPPFTRFALTLGADGVSPSVLSGPAPTSAALCGLEFVAQGLVFDPVAQGGLAFTRGVRLRFGVGSAAASLYQGARFFTAPLPSDVLAAGDLNGDGRADVVVAGWSSPHEGAARVLLQLDDGSLWALPAQPTGSQDNKPRELVVTDLDDDGLLDVIIAYALDFGGPTPPGLSLLRGRGDGSLEAPVLLEAPAGSDPRDLVAADLDGDGLPELVVTNWGQDAVAVLPNLGGSSFGTSVEYPLGGWPVEQHGLQLADVTGDGRLDVLALTSEGLQQRELVILPGTGGTTFGGSQVIHLGFESTPALTTGDVDGDGDVDVAFAGTKGSARGIWWLENLGSSQFSIPIDADGSTDQYLYIGDVHLVDLDQDGLTELVYTVVVEGVWVQPNLGGSFGDPTRLRIQADDLAIADMDGDAQADLLIGEGYPSTVGWLAGLGDGSFDYPESASTLGPSWTAAADVDADGVPDLLTRGSYQDSWFGVQLGAGDGTFGPVMPCEFGGYGSAEPTLGDMDADGDLDAVLACSNPGGPDTVVVLRGLGDGSFGPPEPYPTLGVGWGGGVHLADLDSDGDLDVLVRTNSVGGALLLRRGAGDGTLFPLQLVAEDVFRVLGLGDVDEDGHLDCLYATLHEGVSTLQLLRGVGDGTFSTPELIMPAGSGLESGDLADFDLDGHLDLVLGVEVTPLNHELSVHLGAGDGSFALSHAESVRFVRVDVADVNDDGAPDVVGSSSPINGVMLGFGDGTFAPVQPGGAGGAIADFDGDGDLDTASYGLVFLNSLH